MTKRKPEKETAENGNGAGFDSDETSDEDIEMKKEVDIVEIEGKNKKEGVLEEKKVSFLALFRYADALDIFLMILGAVSAIALGCTLPAFAFIFGDLINTFNLPISELQKILNEKALLFLWVGLAAWVINYFSRATWEVTAQRQAFRIRNKYFEAVLHQDMPWFDSHGSGVLATRMSNDIVVLQEALGEKNATLLQHVTTFIFGFILGLVKGWQLTLVMLALTPLLAISGVVMMKVMTSVAERGQKAYANAGSVATEVLGAMKTVTAFTGEERELKRYEKSLIEAKGLGIKRGFLSGLTLGMVMIIIFGSYGLCLWYGSVLILDKAYTGGDVMTIFFSVMMGAFALGQINPSSEAISKGQAVASHIFETIDRDRKIDSFSEVGEKPENMEGNIELKNVFFKYPNRPEAPVLNGVSLSIKKGQKVALVGHSGCGKSTIISMLERFYDPDSGEIQIDEIPLKNYHLKWYRSQVGLVGQEPVLFAGTIAENIAFGKENSTQEEIEEAAKQANAHKFIIQLPQGYDTFVGERGAQLSGGQKQRIAIARAIIKKPKFLLLDEATSALDNKSEKIVQKALDKVMKGRTSIVIAHRLSTIRDSDIIYVMESGKVVEKGTHEELMQSNGLYKQMVELQGGEQFMKSTKDDKDDEISMDISGESWRKDSLDHSAAAGEMEDEEEEEKIFQLDAELEEENGENSKKSQKKKNTRRKKAESSVDILGENLEEGKKKENGKEKKKK